MASQTAWHISGEVMEACTCLASCPCNFGSDPTQLPCEVVLGWRVADGHYGEVKLSDLNVVLYGRIPGNVFDGNWTVGVYLDQRATPEEAGALGSIFSGQAGGWPAVLTPLIAEALAPKQVPIRFERIDGEPRITVPGLLEVEAERIPNPMPDQPPLDPTATGLAVPFYTGAAHIRRSRKLKLSDPGMSFECTGRSVLAGHFDYSGP